MTFSSANAVNAVHPSDPVELTGWQKIRGGNDRNSKVNYVTFSPNGRWMLQCLESGSPLAVLSDRLAAHSTAPAEERRLELDWSGNGGNFARFIDDTTFVYTRSIGVSWHSCNSYVYTCTKCSDPTDSKVNVKDWKLKQRFSHNDQSFHCHATVSPDGLAMLSGGYSQLVWVDLTPGAPKDGLGNPPKKVVLDPAKAGEKYSVRFWQVTSLACREKEPIFAAGIYASNPENRQSVSRGTIHMWRPDSKKIGTLPQLPSDPSAHATSLLFSRDSSNLLYAGYSSGYIRVWYIGNRTVASQVKMPGAVTSMDFLFDGAVLVASSSGTKGNIKFWAIEGVELRLTASLTGGSTSSTEGVYSVAAIPGETAVYSVAEGVWQIWGCPLSSQPSIEKSIGSVLTCTVCPYSTTGVQQPETNMRYTSNVCQKCEPGFRAKSREEDPTASGCVACPWGTYSDKPGAYECKACPGGRSSHKTESASCSTLCQPGEEMTYRGCKPCSAGDFSTGSTGPAEICTPCAPGSYTAKQGSSKCALCPAGQSSDQGSADCTVCKHGEYAQSGRTCAPCPEGMFQATPGDACLPCRPGTTSREGSLSSGECFPCPAGTASSGKGGECQACPADTFSSAGASSCSQCPEETISPGNASACIAKAAATAQGGDSSAGVAAGVSLSLVALIVIAVVLVHQRRLRNEEKDREAQLETLAGRQYQQPMEVLNDTLRTIRLMYVEPKKIWRTVFISYAWGRPPLTEHLQTFLKKLKQDLENAGLRVMLDIDNLSGGDNIDDYMHDNLARSDFALVVGTPDYKERAQLIDENGQPQTNVGKEWHFIYNNLSSAPEFLQLAWVCGTFTSSLPAEAGNLLALDFTSSSKYYAQVVPLVGKLLSLDKKSQFKMISDNYQLKLQRLSGSDEPTIPSTDLSTTVVAETSLNVAQGTDSSYLDIVAHTGKSDAEC